VFRFGVCPFSRLAGGCPQVIAPQDSKHFFQSRRIQYAEQQNKDTCFTHACRSVGTGGLRQEGSQSDTAAAARTRANRSDRNSGREPSVVQQGQTSTLTWQTSNATDVTIASVGELTSSGSRSVTPTASTTYTLVAKGPGGTSQASASITVNTPVASVAPSPTDEELFSKNVKDVFFDYDKYSIRSDELPTVQTDEAFLVHASQRQGPCRRAL